MLVKNSRKVLIIFVAVVFIFMLLMFSLRKGTFSQVNSSDSDYKVHFVGIGKDAIIIESNGHYGLIDTAFASDNYGNLPYDSYSHSQYNALTIVNYLKNIGVSHLDFVIVTHSHSDHNGGVVELCESALVNEETTFIYKKYEELYDIENSPEANYGNMYFYNRAISAMKDKGAIMHETSGLAEDIAHGVLPTAGVLQYASLSYDEEIYYDNPTDYIQFNFYGSKIEIYNLYENFAEEENLNSLVVLFKTNNKKMLFMGDITSSDDTELKIGQKIGDVDLLKVGDHGRETATSIQFLKMVIPENVIIFNDTITSTNFGVPYLYLKNNNAKTYMTSQSGSDNYMALVASVSNDGVSMLTYDRNKKLSLEANPLSISLSDGFYARPSGNYSDDKFYIRNGKFIVNDWLQLNEGDSTNWYYFDEDGIMLTEWQTINDKTFYFDYDGKMTIGWKQIENKWYYFKSSEDFPSISTSDLGTLLTGKHQLKYNGKVNWYYLKPNTGERATGVIKIDNKLYHFSNSDGIWSQFTGEKEISNKIYYFNSDFSLKTGWHTLENGDIVYFSEETGEPLKNDTILKYEGHDSLNYFDQSTGALLAQIIGDNNFKFDTDKNYITGIKAGTTVYKVFQNISIKPKTVTVNIALVNKDNIEKGSSQIVSTGDKLVVYINNRKVKEYTLSVVGDVNGDGKVTNTDIDEVSKSIINKSSLQGIYSNAADIDSNNLININDVIGLTKYITQNWELK